jgi:polysaccharide biosynthesis protein PslG
VSPLEACPPRGGWLVAALATLALIGGVSTATGASGLETASIDLRHRWVALTGGRDQPRVVLSSSAALRGPAILNPLGVNTFLEQEVEPAKRQRSLDLLKAAGVGWIRQELPWEQIEPVAKGQTQDPSFGGSTWTKFDDIVDRAQAAGIDLLLRLDTSPRWALPTGATDGLGPPVNFDDYFDFVEQVATRYRGRVRAYQIWNEPNLTNEWGHQPPDPAAYVRLLQGASQRIRRADPSAQVVMAALAPTLTQSVEAQNELLFLQQVYDAGAHGGVDFDVLAVQAYGLRGGPDDPRIGSADVTFSRPQLVRQVMERNADQATPVWATEVGWDTNPPALGERYGRVTPPLQARYTVRAFARARQQWPWLESLYVWYWKRADDADRDQDWYWFRLADPDFTLQPVYYALRDTTPSRR